MMAHPCGTGLYGLRPLNPYGFQPIRVTIPCANSRFMPGAARWLPPIASRWPVIRVPRSTERIRCAAAPLRGP